MCDGQDQLLPDLLCGWMPDGWDAPAEGVHTLFAYLQILRAVLSMLYGIFTKAGNCVRKDAALPGGGDLAKPLLSDEHDSEAGIAPAPAPEPEPEAKLETDEQAWQAAVASASRPASPSRGDGARQPQPEPEPEPEAGRESESDEELFSTDASRPASPQREREPPEARGIALHLTESQRFGESQRLLDPIHATDLRDLNAKLGEMLGLDFPEIEVFNEAQGTWRVPADLEEARLYAPRTRLFKGRRSTKQGS